MLPKDVPLLPGYLTTIDVQERLQFRSRQAAVNLLLSGVLPDGSVYRIANGYIVDEKTFERYVRARVEYLRQREHTVQAGDQYQQLRRKVREWAEAQGVPFPKRGRMSESLVVQYRVAQTGDQPSAA